MLTVLGTPHVRGIINNTRARVYRANLLTTINYSINYAHLKILYVTKCSCKFKDTPNNFENIFYKISTIPLQSISYQI